MEWFPHYLSLAVACGVLSYGLRRRAPWMWYLGWVMFYLFAGYFGHFYLTALYLAESAMAMGYVLIYLLGGMVLWIPSVIWWATHRHVFGLKAPPATPSRTKHPGPGFETKSEAD